MLTLTVNVCGVRRVDVRLSGSLSVTLQSSPLPTEVPIAVSTDVHLVFAAESGVPEIVVRERRVYVWIGQFVRGGTALRRRGVPLRRRGVPLGLLRRQHVSGARAPGVRRSRLLLRVVRCGAFGRLQQRRCVRLRLRIGLRTRIKVRWRPVRVRRIHVPRRLLRARKMPAEVAVDVRRRGRCMRGL